MRIWKYTALDGLLLLYSLFQFLCMIIFACKWSDSSSLTKFSCFTVLIVLITYNIIVVSHLFTHAPWFKSKLLNGIVSLLNTINIGQSVQEYQLNHVRNHHKYNNDQKGEDGKTKDLSSTYQNGYENEHLSLLRYAVLGGLESFYKILISLPMNIIRLGRIGKHESVLRNLLSTISNRRKEELLQLKFDRLAHSLGICLFLIISWKWTVFCYLPAFLTALILVNVQNYYEHYGANPKSKFANSVSYYGRVYNLLTFNDGYHQEHHLYCSAHWTTMPEIYKTFFSEDKQKLNRIISPFPALLGFLDYKRPLLHKKTNLEPSNLVNEKEFVGD